MLSAVVLICALSVEPEDCGETNARWFGKVPGIHATPYACFVAAQEWTADNMPHGLEDVHIVVRCSHSEFSSDRPV